MRRNMPIFYSAIILTAVNLLLRFAGTSFQVYISGRIGAAGIGLLQLILSVGSFAMTAGMAGIRTATMYLTAEELGRKHPGNVWWVLSSCAVYSLICSSFIGVLLYVTAPQLAQNWIGMDETVICLRLLAFLLPFNCLCGMMTGYFTAANRIGTLAAVEVAEQLCSMTATTFLLYNWAGTEAVRACQAVILGSGIGTLLTLSCLLFLRLREQCAPGARIPVRSRLLQISVPLALADDLKAGINTTENLMVPKRLALYPYTDDPLSAFGIVTGMVFPVLMFPAAILFGLAELLIPELARCAAAHSAQRIRYLVKRSLKVAMLYGCFFAGLMFLLSKPLCLALYSSEDAALQLKRFSLLIPVLYCDAITDAMTKGLGQQKACVRYNITTSLMDVGLLYLLLPRYGMEGYYFSFLLTHLINFALSLRRLLLISGYTPSAKTVICTLLATVVSVIIAVFATNSLVCAIGFMIILSCLLMLFGVVGKEDVLWLKGLLYQK